jgi:A/G-specific adenine glycosylase
MMLQQTRVETVIPYFVRWMKRFPTVQAVAEASERDILRSWEGLGYYSRARNLHRAARVVREEYGGELPSEARLLRNLPGIGPYTAGAISSIAFGRDEAALDANIRRVLSRVFNVSRSADSPGGRKILWSLAVANLPEGRAGEFNQALMDLGAAVCLPKLPHCDSCPATSLCEARRRGLQGRRPVLAPRRSTPRHMIAAAVIRKGGRVLISRRAAHGLLGGMWEFPNVTLATDNRVREGSLNGFARGLRTAYGLKVRRRGNLGTIKHAYSHFKVTVAALECELDSRSSIRSLEWVSIRNLESYPMGKIDRQIARKLIG